MGPRAGQRRPLIPAPDSFRERVLEPAPAPPERAAARPQELPPKIPLKDTAARGQSTNLPRFPCAQLWSGDGLR